MTSLSQFCVLIGCLLGLVTIPSCIADYIYFTSPGGAEGGDRPGIYGGPIRTDENGAASNLYASGYHCAVLEPPDTFNELEFRSLSYDPVSKNVLMHIKDTFTVLKSPVCRAQPLNCVNRTGYITPIFIKKAFSQDVRPVAYYQSTIYFLTFTSETVNTKEKDATLEIRRFVGCEEEYPITGNKAFDLEVCSELIATIRKERYELAPMSKPADHLIVVRDGNSQRFFTILKHFVFENRRIQAYKFQLVTIYRGKVDVLDEQEVDKSFNTLSLDQLGGLSFQDGVICWSAISRIICADWRSGRIENRRVLLDDVASSGVCKGTSERITSNVSTGVTIATVRPNLVVYFGCVSQVRGKGGMGMIREKRDGSTEIKNVTNDGNPVFAGSMFITKECKSDKPKPSNGNHPTISGGSNPKEGHGGREVEPAESSYASSANGILGLLTYAHVLMAAILVRFV